MGSDEEGRAVIEEALRRYGAPEGCGRKIDRYAEMIAMWRGWAGLTSRRTAESPERAIVESLTVLEVAGEDELEVVDIGAGGGLLGVPLALARPSWRMVLLERSGRKCAFLAEVIGTLGMESTRVLKGSAEQYAGAFAFDLALSRAVGDVNSISGLALPLLARGGRYVSLRGGGEPPVSVREDGLAVPGAGAGGVFAAGGSGVPPTSLVVVEKL